METGKVFNSVVRSVGDFNLLNMHKKWAGNVSGQIKEKFNRLKLEYTRSRTDHNFLRVEDGFNTLKVNI
ncbi:MAG: hypothetical protein JXB00_18935 [Bacteroidales bacterium]|nr:hypothetical protein [Bacteroidales bacterium]